MSSNPVVKKAVVYGIIQVLLVGTVFACCCRYVAGMARNKTATQAAFVNPAADDPGMTPVDKKNVNTTLAARVFSGLYLDRVEDVDIIRSKMKLDFYVWFRWNPNEISFLDMKDSLKKGITNRNCPFTIVNGDINFIQTKDHYVNPPGDSAYIAFFVKSEITKFFDVSTYPIDGHSLMLQIEPLNFDACSLVFVADTANTNVSSRVAVNGYIIDSSFILSKLHTIKSNYGDPRKQRNADITNSQLRMALRIRREDLVVYIKTFIPLYVAVLVAFLSFFAGEKFKIAIIMASLFTVAATLNMISSKIPVTTVFSIAELVNDISLVTIFLIVSQETIIRVIMGANERLKYLTHWTTFTVALAFYIAINIAIPLISFY